MATFNKQPFVCVIALSWNAKDLLKQCLDSFYTKTNYKNYKVIIVENGSMEDCVVFSRERYKKADVLWIRKNRGFAGGMNFGIRYALKKYKPDYILLLSNDVKTIQRKWLKLLVERSADISQPTLLNSDRSVQSVGGGFSIFGIPFPLRRRERPFWAVGASIIVKREVFESIGLLDEDYLAYAEDLDFCWRARRKGFDVNCVYDAKIIHLVSATTRKKHAWKPGYSYYYYQSRNILLTIMKNTNSKFVFLSSLILSFLEFLVLLIRNRAGAIGILKGIFSVFNFRKKFENGYDCRDLMDRRISILFEALLIKAKKHVLNKFT